MRAVRFHEHGGPEVLRLEEVPTPEPSPDAVLVRVRACGLNHVDILSREARTPGRIALPHISGTEVAGEVAAVGACVSQWRPGDPVVVVPALSCGRCEPCRSGEDNMCLEGAIFGVQTDGGYAEFCLAPADHLLRLPDGVSAEVAAAIAVTGSTAWHMLVRRAALRQGEDVLIVAAGSGIGALAVQIAKLSGARVIATAGSAAKLEGARALGADHVVNHSDPEWHRQVRDLTNRRGVDVVFEHVGEATWEKSVACLTRGGRLVTCGAHTGSDVRVNLWHLFVKQLSLIGSFAGTRRDLTDVLRMCGRGLLRPVIHDRLPLEAAADGQRLMAERAIFGKLLLVPGEMRGRA